MFKTHDVFRVYINLHSEGATLRFQDSVGEYHKAPKNGPVVSHKVRLREPPFCATYSIRQQNLSGVGIWKSFRPGGVDGLAGSVKHSTNPPTPTR
jgi:hypothetical protein